MGALKVKEEFEKNQSVIQKREEEEEKKQSIKSDAQNDVDNMGFEITMRVPVETMSGSGGSGKKNTGVKEVSEWKCKTCSK